MSPLDRAAVDALFPAGLPEVGHWQRRYPPRQLPEGAQVTRVSPSPTGHAHIGSVYVAMIDADVARHSGGTYFVRVEDTDRLREVEGAAAQFDRVFSVFGVSPDETDPGGAYGPYTQSARSPVYLSHVRELLRRNKAYPCFATRDELAANVAAQRAAKVPTGYYGRWAIWRDAPAERVGEYLAAGRPYVVRFRSPASPGDRIGYHDLIRGELEADANLNDAVILKSSDQHPRLPTYHFAHAVDDHLMGVTVVIRGDEWISSVPLHLQLFDALGFPRVGYAHIAPLMKMEGGSRRKLSKRKDPEASVDHYLQAGYPVEAVLYYLRGLANGRLAELPLAEALAAPILLEECGAAGPLVDMAKLDDISADFVATLPGEEILRRLAAWAADHDPDLAAVLDGDRDLALRALAVERDGVPNPRKDLRRWSDFRTAYGFFFPSLFERADDGDPRFGGLDPRLVHAMLDDLAERYRPHADPGRWFDQVRDLAARHGFAPTPKAHKADPGVHPGSIREASQVVRVALTGATRSPDLAAVAHALGAEEVVRRLRR
ncbi:glutamate--tRNA ligase family protein [Streptosporangium sp. NPDC023963]|uniref:glutamate--tRNA ligase n=1 Tax=Streptosporangium sp. NPDC023963 TaxID=3155608 RepID=UPI003429F239